MFFFGVIQTNVLFGWNFSGAFHSIRNLPSCTAATAVLAELAAWEETLLSYWGSVSQQPMLGMRKFGLKASRLLTFFFLSDWFWIDKVQKIGKKWTQKRRQLASESVFFPAKYEIIVKSPCISRTASLQASMDRREADSCRAIKSLLGRRFWKLFITSATIPLKKQTTNKKCSIKTLLVGGGF